MTLNNGATAVSSLECGCELSAKKRWKVVCKIEFHLFCFEVSTSGVESLPLPLFSNIM